MTSANALLAGERGASRLRRLKRALMARRARMIAQLAAALGLGFHTGVSLYAGALPDVIGVHGCSTAAHLHLSVRA